MSEEFIENKEDKIYYEEEKNIRKYFDTQLLSELLFINSKHPTSEYHTNNIEHIYNTLFDSIVYTYDELKEIRQNALALLKIKYNISIDGFKD